MFQSQIYIDRRNALAEQLGSGMILLPGNGQVGMNYAGNHYHFRQDSNFLYFIGIDQPHLAATIDALTGITTLYGDDATMDDVVWTGPVPTIAALGERSGIYKTKPISALAGDLEGEKVHFTPPYRMERQVWISELTGIPIREVKSKVSVPMIKAIVKLRSIKSEAEIEEMELAVQTTCIMHNSAMVTAEVGLYESQAYASACHSAFSANSRPSFPIILTQDGQTLHNHLHDQPFKAGRLVLCDCGAESPMHYAGDMTRTFPVNSTFSQQQREVYNIVLASQEAAIKTLKPGVLYRDAHLTAAATIAEGLKNLGLMKGDVQEAVAAGAHALFFPHGLGHQIGLDVHDMEDLGEDYVGYDDEVKRSDQFGLAFLRLGKALEAGNVITVEPGIYFIPELIDQWKANGTCQEFINFDALDAYRDFGGIRIEDDYTITETGSKLLWHPFIKTVEDIEAQWAF